MVRLKYVGTGVFALNILNTQHAPAAWNNVQVGCCIWPRRNSTKSAAYRKRDDNAEEIPSQSQLLALDNTILHNKRLNNMIQHYTHYTTWRILTTSTFTEHSTAPNSRQTTDVQHIPAIFSVHLPVKYCNRSTTWVLRLALRLGGWPNGQQPWLMIVDSTPLGRRL